MSLRIGMITPSFYPMVGGIELYALSISKELVKRGHEVHVYTPQRVMKQNAGPLEEEFGGLHIHRQAPTLDFSYRARFSPRIFPHLLQDASSLDLVHIHGQDHIHSFLAFLSAKLGKLPTIVSTYGPMMYQTEHSLKKRPFFEFYDGIITPLMLQRADFVLAKFPSLLPWVLRQGVSRAKIGLAPSGIPPIFTSQPRLGYLQEKLKPTGPIILYVGRLSRQKGVQHLVQAMPNVLKEIPDALLVLVGPDYANLAPYLRGVAHELGIESNLSLIGPVYDVKEEMMIYASCDVFVMPSSFEGFSQAVLKAMAQAKPVVATKVGGLSWEVRDGVDGILVDYGDHLSLARALTEILQNEKIAREMGDSGRKRAGQFTYPKLAEEVEKAYFYALSPHCHNRLPGRS